ncbi:MAG: ATP-binding protein [Muribaculaceae bacterium]|nr:ATP-binding protein [Muribaculaceae bacterium]
MTTSDIPDKMFPIGIQNFPEIIVEGYTYVDKTYFVGKLIKGGKYNFLSRPRRFGKSLLLSTIQTYFEGRRDLFKGLAIDNMDLDWTPRPIFYFDFNTGNYGHPDGLKNRLISLLNLYEKEYDVEVSMEEDTALRFENLIRQVYKKTGQQVVILVDEYDKPLLNLDENPEQFEKNQRMLKGFFSNLKSMDACIKFGMLTGVARFSKVSIFSDLNNLEDISMLNDYCAICGWTEEELVGNFRSGIQALADEREEDFDTTLRALRDYYDGYLFSGKGSRIYNPFSVLRALKGREIMPYWFETGTPTFLAKKIRKIGIDPESLNGQTQSYSNLIAVGVGTDNITPLMFQTGYLTIESYDSRRQRYTLRFPNREVEIGFAQNLLPLYAPSTDRPDSHFSIERFKDDLYDGDPNSFMKRLGSLIKDLPYEDHKESTYRAITYLLCLLSGTEAIPERHSYKGRSDLEALTPDYVYIFEFKYNKSVDEAMKQIYSQDYAGRYTMDSRKVYLIGANLNEDKEDRTLDYEIVELQ